MKIKDKVLEQYKEALNNGNVTVATECKESEGEVAVLDGPGFGAEIIFLKQVDIESEWSGEELRVFPNYKWAKAKSQKDMLLNMVRKK